MKNYHNSVILRPKLLQICIYLKIRKFADSPLREKNDDIISSSYIDIEKWMRCFTFKNQFLSMSKHV